LPQRKLPPKRLLRLLKPKKTKKKRLMLPNMLLSKLLPRFQETKKGLSADEAWTVSDLGGTMNLS